MKQPLTDSDFKYASSSSFKNNQKSSCQNNLQMRAFLLTSIEMPAGLAICKTLITECK